MVNPLPSLRETVPKLLEGFRYWPELIGPAEEGALLARVRTLPLQDLEFHGYTGRPCVVSSGASRR